MMKREAQRRKQRAREKIECPVHSYQLHGKEAEQLRKGVEKLLAKFGDNDGWTPGKDLSEDYEGLRDGLSDLLDTVDARDSLAYLERVADK